MKDLGYTLAETLITIGIIGVVSALTIPTLVKNYQQKTTVEKLKKSYAMFQQVIKLSTVDNGELEGWDYTLSNEEFAQRYFIPYLKGASKKTNYHTAKSLTGGAALRTFSHSSRTQYDLIDGSCISFEINESTHPKAIGHDLNCESKPNIYGKDIFVYSINEGEPKTFDFLNVNSSMSPNYRSPNRTETLASERPFSCTKDNTWLYYSGSGCGYLIKIDGWKISKDYPW